MMHVCSSAEIKAVIYASYTLIHLYSRYEVAIPTTIRMTRLGFRGRW